jgi:dTDP-glucose 4,6-dehydratase
MRILVTGGAGFIGSNFVRRILDGSLAGYSSVTVLDKLTYAGNMENLPDGDFEFIPGDICDEKLVQSLAKRHDSIVNFAAESHVDRSIHDPKSFFNTNIHGVQNILDAVRGVDNCKFLQISTDEVYGSISSGSADENYVLLPNSPYAASKAAADLIVRSYFQTYGLNVLVTRSSNNYGPNQYPEKLIPLFVSNLIERKRLPIYGNGENIRDWIHVDDNCFALHAALLGDNAGKIYNIGGGNEFSNLSIAQKIANSMGLDSSVFDFVQDRAGHDFRYSVNATKIENELGIKPSISFDDGLSGTINWYRENVAWWSKLK